MRIATLAIVLAGCSCGEPPAPASVPGEPFVASAADFVDFDRWERFDRGPRGFLPSHPDGETFVYLNRRPPDGATSYPIGTILVRVTQAGPLSDWEVHAMVKRGGGFNTGAPGWEYFDLEMARTGERLTPRVRWRGEGPGDGEDGYARGAEGVRLGCNHCHGAVPQQDCLIGEELLLAP